MVTDKIKIEEIDINHLRHIHGRLVQNYNNDVPFEQFEEDRLVLFNAIQFLENYKAEGKNND